MARNPRWAAIVSGVPVLLLAAAASLQAGGGVVVTTTGTNKAVTATSASAHALYATSTSTSTAGGYAGYFVGVNYRALYVLCEADWYDAYFAGIGGIYSHGGYWEGKPSATLVQNGGDEPIEEGDIVALAGVAVAPATDQPILMVAKASATHHPAIVGVAVRAARVEARAEGDRETADVQPVDGPAPPGGYLFIVSSGLVPRVKVDASSGLLRPGDWIAASHVPGLGRGVARRPPESAALDSASVEAIEPHSNAISSPGRPRKPVDLVSPGAAWPAFRADGQDVPSAPAEIRHDEAPQALAVDDWRTPTLGMVAAPPDAATGTVPVFVMLR